MERIPHNFVTPGPPPVQTAPRADVLRREDVLETQRLLLATYTSQQAALLSDVQNDVSSGGYVSSAPLAAERRRTSAMYLLLYSGCAAGAMGGLTLLGTLAVGWQPLVAIATWLAGTALGTIFMAWRRHGQELEHSPEGIARHLLDWHGEVALFEAETRRQLLDREHALALLDRQTAASAAADTRRLAQQLSGRRHQAPPTAYTAPTRNDSAVAVLTPTPTQPEPPTAPAAVDNTVDNTADNTVDTAGSAILQWAAGLFDGGLAADGVVLGRVPWAARSPWAADDKLVAAAVCTRSRPILFVQSAGGRWRLRLEVAGNADQLIALLSQRLDGRP